MSAGTKNPIEGLVRLFRADMKKTGTLAVLGVVLLVMVVRQMGGGKTARPAAAAGASVASKTDAQHPSLAASSRNPAAAEALAEWTRQPIGPVSRNLFAVRIEYFAMEGNRTSQSGVTEENFWSNLENSLTLRTDEKVRQDNLVASFVKEAEKLQLQSTLPEARTAMINGQLVGEGSVVANFRVVKIEPRKVIVEREGIKLAVQMK